MAITIAAEARTEKLKQQMLQFLDQNFVSFKGLFPDDIEMISGPLNGPSLVNLINISENLDFEEYQNQCIGINLNQGTPIVQMIYAQQTIKWIASKISEKVIVDNQPIPRGFYNHSGMKEIAVVEDATVEKLFKDYHMLKAFFTASDLTDVVNKINTQISLYEHYWNQN